MSRPPSSVASRDYVLIFFLVFVKFPVAVLLVLALAILMYIDRHIVGLLGHYVVRLLRVIIFVIVIHRVVAILKADFDFV